MISLPIGLKQSVKKNNNEPLWIREPTTNPVWGGGGAVNLRVFDGVGGPKLQFRNTLLLFLFIFF